MRVFTKVRELLVLVPNFPNLLSGFDTQPFFLLSFFRRSIGDLHNLRLFAIFMLAFLSEYTLTGHYGLASDLVIFSIFIFLLCFARFTILETQKFYASLRLFVVFILLFSAIRYSTPVFEWLFSPREVVAGIGRSFAYVYPEASYAAKNFFFFYCFFLVSLNRASLLLVLLQFGTLSLTGFITGLISISLYLLFTNIRKFLIFLTGLIALSFLMIALNLDADLLRILPASRIRSLLLVSQDAGISGVIDFLVNDQSLLYRLNEPLSNINTNNLTSLLSYVVSFPISVSALLIFFVLLRVPSSRTIQVIICRILVIVVGGYADTFVYPSFALALTAIPSSIKNDAVRLLQKPAVTNAT